MGGARRVRGVLGGGVAGGGATLALEVELLATWGAGGGAGDATGTGAGVFAAHQTPAAINTAAVPADRPTVTKE